MAKTTVSYYLDEKDIEYIKALAEKNGESSDTAALRSILGEHRLMSGKYFPARVTQLDGPDGADKPIAVDIVRLVCPLCGNFLLPIGEERFLCSRCGGEFSTKEWEPKECAE